MRTIGFVVVAFGLIAIYLSFYGLALPSGVPHLPFQFTGNPVETVNRQVSPSMVVGKWWYMNMTGIMFGIQQHGGSNATVTSVDFAGTSVQILVVNDQLDGSQTSEVMTFNVSIVYDSLPSVVGQNLAVGDDLLKPSGASMFKFNTVKNMDVGGSSRSVVGYVGTDVVVDNQTFSYIEFMFDQSTGMMAYERAEIPSVMSFTVWVTSTNMFTASNPNWDIWHIIAEVNAILARQQVKEALLLGGVAAASAGLAVAFWPKKKPF